MKKIILILIYLMFSYISYSQEEYKDIDLYKNRNFLFMKVKCNNKDGKLLIDTGASKSLLDINKSVEYGFTYKVLYDTLQSKYVGIGGIDTIYIVFNYNMSSPFISFLGADLKQISYYMEEDGIDFLGIIGSDFMIKYNCVLDYKNKRLRIQRRF